MLYRIWQSWKNLTGNPHPRDLAEAGNLLTPAELRLFQALAPADQAHSLRVFRQLKEEGERHPALLKAALLHDVGKAGTDLSLWERTGAVLVQALSSTAGDLADSRDSRGWRRGVHVARSHPLWGADSASQVGAGELTVWLIKHHQDDPGELEASLERLQLLKKLIRADNQN